MYRITGQAINLRYIATEIKLDTPLSEESTYIETSAHKTQAMV